MTTLLFTFAFLFLLGAIPIHALVLKRFMTKNEVELRRRGVRNSFKYTLKISVGTLIAASLLAMVPWVGVILAPVAWFFIIDDIYEQGFRRNAKLFVMQGFTLSVWFFGLFALTIAFGIFKLSELFPL